MTDQHQPLAARPTITPPSAPRTATRGQRWGLFLGVGIALLFCLWLFQGILTPFVLAATIAYFLDPLATRFARQRCVEIFELCEDQQKLESTAVHRFVDLFVV